MEQFIKERIGFSLALLGVVLALHPFVKDNPDFGFTILNIPFLVKHFYLAFSLFLGTAVYFYGVQYLKVRWLSFTEKIGTACFLLAILTPVTYVSIFIFSNLFLLIGNIAQQQWLNKALSISSVLLSIIGTIVGYFFGQRSLMKREKEEKISKTTQKGISFIETAQRMISAGLYGPALIQLFSSIMLNIRKALFAEQAETQRMADFKVLEYAVKKGILPQDIVSQVHELRQFRNQLAHAHNEEELEITKEQAESYLNLSRKIASRFQSESFIGGSPCQMSGQKCPGCKEGVMDVAQGEDGVICNNCGLFIPAYNPQI